MLARKIPDLLTDSVIPKLDSYLDELPADIDIRIDQLVCDIGPVSFSKLEQDLPRLIADSLLKHFQQSLSQSSAPLLPIAKFPAQARLSEREKHVQSSAQSQLEAVLYFLKNGHAPWWFPAASWQGSLHIADWPAAQLAELENALIQSIHSSEVAVFHRFIRHIYAESVAALLEKTTFHIHRDFTPTELMTFQKLRPYQRTAVLSIIWLQHRNHPNFSAIFREISSQIPDVSALPKAARSLLQKHFSPASPQATTAAAPEISNPTAVENPSTVVSSLPDLASPNDPPHSVAADADFSEPPCGFPISNAGIVLLHPFIPHLFQGLGWLDATKQILPTQRWHAVQALQFLSRGDCGFSEASLLLDKVLCGLPIAALADEATLSPEVRAECDALLTAAIKHWSILGNTSPAGLRECFLKRPGLLDQDDDGCWRVHVERQAIDVLLGHLPWPLSIIKLPWMNQPLHITWI